MSTRYVWEKWNAIGTDYYVYQSRAGSVSYGGTSRPNFPGGNNYYKDYTLDPKTGTITLTGKGQESTSSWSVGFTTTSYGPISGNISIPAGEKFYQFSYGYSEGYDDVPGGFFGDYYYRYAQPRNYSKGSTSYGNVSSGSSGAYPANSYSGNYWYVSKGNDTIDPASVTYSASPNGGELVDITIAPSTGIKFGGTIKYKVEYQLDGGSWQTAVEATSSTTVSVLIPKGTQTFTARATASDDTGFTSTTAVTGETVSVVNNAAPVISCETSSLGEIAEPFSVSYSVSDEDGDTMTITEKIDGTTIRSYSAPSGSSGEQTFSPDAMQWLTTLNGSHTATIAADDGKGGVTTHSISFTRAVHTMTVTLEEPMETDAAITKCVVNIARNLPADAEWSLLVTNNAFDPEPVWEDITQYVKNGWNWVFENQTITSGRYGFNFKLTCTRGASGQGGYVDTISGGFE